ncbi:MAG: Verru_Chthon cassette protein B [Chthoniobacteraceae bacterium]
MSHNSNITPRPSGHASSRGFSLVEITMALGIVSCAMLVIVGLLPVGLQSMQDSAVQYGISTLSQQISSELQEKPFTGSGVDPLALSGTTNYYTREGMLTTGTDTGMNSYPYFAATFTTSGTATSNIPGATTTYPQNLQLVTVKVSYPYQAPANSQQTNVLSFLVARQNSL